MILTPKQLKKERYVIQRLKDATQRDEFIDGLDAKISADSADRVEPDLEVDDVAEIHNEPDGNTNEESDITVYRAADLNEHPYRVKIANLLAQITSIQCLYRAGGIRSFAYIHALEAVTSDPKLSSKEFSRERIFFADPEAAIEAEGEQESSEFSFQLVPLPLSPEEELQFQEISEKLLKQRVQLLGGFLEDDLRLADSGNGLEM